jgi:WD40 repeat protein
MTHSRRAAFLLFTAALLLPSPVSAQEAATRRDAQGDLLPEHALVRFGTLRWRHGAAISFVAHTPDGKGLVTDSQDGTLRLWDLATGAEVRRFVKTVKRTADGGQIALVRSQGHGAALSPDGKVLAAGAADGTITLWDLATAKVIRSFQSDSTPLASLVFADDGELLLAKDYDQVLRLWDVSTGKELRTFGKQSERNIGFQAGPLTGSPVFLSKGDVVASVSIQFKSAEGVTSVRRWDQVTGRELQPISLKGGNGFLTSNAFAPDRKTLVAGSGFDAPIRLYDLATGKELRTLEGQTMMSSFVSQIAFAPDGKTVVAWSSDNTIRMWDVASGKLLRRIGEPSGPQFMGIYLARTTVSNFAFSSDGKYMTLGTNGSSIRRWEVETGQELSIANGHLGGIAALALSADGKTVVTRGADRSIRVWDRATGQETSRVVVPGDVTQAALTPDGQTVALGNPAGKLLLWDVRSGKELRHWQVSEGGFVGLTFAPDGKTLATRGVDRMVRLWDPSSAKEIAQISEVKEGETAPNNINAFTSLFASDTPSLAFSADGAALAAMPPADSRLFRQAGGRIQPQRGAALRRWDVGTGKRMHSFDELKHAVAAFACTPDGRTLATANGDGSMHLWETMTGMVRLRIQRSEKEVLETLAFSPDSRILAGSGPGAVICLWDALTGQELARLSGHQGDVHTLLFTADGKGLFSGSSDTTALLWDVERLHRTSKPYASTLADGGADMMWHALAGADAERAHQAVARLAGAPDRALAVLRRHLRPVPAVDADNVVRLLEELDGDLAVRQKAFRELDKLGDRIGDAFTQALAAQPGLERRQRLERLQERVLNGTTMSAEERQTLRAIEVLEHIGTPPARSLLHTLADGAAGARITREAEAALRRVEAR